MSADVRVALPFRLIAALTSSVIVGPACASGDILMWVGVFAAGPFTLVAIAQ